MNKKQFFYIRFGAGLVMALLGAVMMFFGYGALSVRITFGIIGIALIATSPVGLK